MEQYIPKSDLVTEIESLKSAAETMLTGKTDLSYWKAQKHLCKRILSFINNLEVKEVDLEEKATQLSQKYFPDEENIWARSNIEAQRCKSACIEMVEWLKAQKGEEV